MSFKLSIGKAAITTEPMYSNEAIMAFKDKHVIQLLPDYVYYMLTGKNWDECANKAVKGKTLNKATLSKIKVNIHDLPKQREIVAVLDKTKSLIDKRNRELKQLDNLIKARFVEMFVDKGYREMTVHDVCDTSFWLMPATPDFVVDGEIPYITSKNIKNGTIDFDNVKYITSKDFKSISANRPTQIGDVLVSMIGTLGQTAVIKDDRAFYGQNLYLLRLDNTIIDTTYFCEFFRSAEVQHILQGKRNQSTQAYLKANHVEDLILPVASLELQREFADFVKQVDKSKFVGMNFK